MRKKIIFFLTTIFGIATIASGYWWYTDDRLRSTDYRKIPIISEPTEESATEEIKKIDEDKKVTDYTLQETQTTKKISSTSTTENTNPEKKFEASVILEINDTKLLLPYSDGMTAEDAMNETMKKYPDKFSYHGTNYGAGLGTFVEEINGIKDDNKEKMHWILYINGKKSNKGISTLILTQNDIIKWNYEKEIL